MSQQLLVEGTVSNMTSTEIVKIRGRQILDSRGRPTIEVDVAVAGGATATASVPSGSSKGAAEVHELRDESAECYDGYGVTQAIEKINTELFGVLNGRDALDQVDIDARMRDCDGTPRLTRLGGNAVLGVSMAVCRAAALAQQRPLHHWLGELARSRQPTLPMPMVSILSGNLHAADGMDVQDFLILPVGACSFTEALQWALRVRKTAADCADSRGMPALMTDNGALGACFVHGEEALDFLMQAIEQAGLRPGVDIAIALDIDANVLVASPDRYEFRRAKRSYTSEQLIELLIGWTRNYPIVSIEDPLHEESWEAWRSLTRKLSQIQVVGDTIFSTQPGRIARGVHAGVANAVLVKLNQNGTLSGTLEAISEARQGGYRTIIAGRLGETEDSFIADLAVGVGAGQIKVGSVRCSERMSKYNQLLRIEERDDVPFAGHAAAH
ncbi:MAG: enolase [Bradyrhizobium sp.]|nr:enolase [Bradyrhizobium sp.]